MEPARFYSGSKWEREIGGNLINGREAVRGKVKWGIKRVIPLGLKVNQAILMAGQKVRLVLRLFAMTLAFSLLDIFVGRDSV